MPGTATQLYIQLAEHTWRFLHLTVLNTISNIASLSIKCTLDESNQPIANSRQFNHIHSSVGALSIHYTNVLYNILLVCDHVTHKQALVYTEKDIV